MPGLKPKLAKGRSLAEYHAKRDFTKTDEPAGSADTKPSSTLSFVIQKHAARRLHFDFRLELDGVLLSWAVPKGPSRQPKTRRLAVRTEDHPIEYGKFEGTIAKGEYGGGSVMLWDRGTWTPVDDPREGLKKGRLTFTLEGERLKGRWHLVRRAGEQGDKSWLLFKGRDEHATNEPDDVADQDDTSVTSGRTMGQIADGGDATWQSGRLVDLVRRIPTTVRFTNLDKVLFATTGQTKAALAAYYAVVAEHALPHLRGRPLTLFRCPNGVNKECFFQKHANQTTPRQLRRLPIADDEGHTSDYLTVDDPDGILATVQLGVLELHIWGSHEDHLEQPNRLVFDIDPHEALKWSAVTDAAKALKALLEDLHLESFLMTTGGKGLHVVVPVIPRLQWDEAKAFTKGVVTQLASDAPSRYTTSPLKSARKGKIFLDYLRNGRGATAVAPYSTRARPNAPVATPIAWSEIDKVDLARFTIGTLAERLDGSHGNPWKSYFEVDQAISVRARRRVA